MFYYDPTYLLVLIGLLLGLMAQWWVKHQYDRQRSIPTQRGIPAAQVAAELLRREGNHAVTIRHIHGEMTDNYNPLNETLNLSDGVYQSDSVAALGIAAHEVGHAIQKQTDYAPMRLRSALVLPVNIGSNLSMPIFLAGLVFSMQFLVMLGIVLFSLALVFSLVTLPVEFDASRRGLQMLTDGGYLTASEQKGVKKVLRAAAMTYVASTIATLLSLLRLLLIANRNRSRR